MTIVLSGTVRVRHKDVAASLATELGWRLVDADEFRFLPLQVAPVDRPGAGRPTWIGALHQTVAFAADRREPLIVVGPPLNGTQREALRGSLRCVRYVELRERGDWPGTGRPVEEADGSHDDVDLVVDVDPHATPERVLGAVREAFGV